MGFWSCNIDRRGRWIRLASGLIALAAAVVLWRYGLKPAACAAGLFASLGLFQAARGWCVVRAFGLRTRW